MTVIIATSKEKNPCVGCGACCAFFRVSFHWMECKSAGGTGTVPDENTEQVNFHHVAMKGTTGANPRCIKLEGELGKDAKCSDYDNRPTPCRDFDASWQFGEHEPRCDKARLSHNLPLLTKDDWN